MAIHRKKDQVLVLKVMAADMVDATGFGFSKTSYLNLEGSGAINLNTGFSSRTIGKEGFAANGMGVDIVDVKYGKGLINSDSPGAELTFMGMSSATGATTMRRSQFEFRYKGIDVGYENLDEFPKSGGVVT